MSKNFEEEYRQMIDSELPDLWDRIEAQLPKSEAAVSEETEIVVTVGSSRNFRNRWMPAVVAIAAALLFVIAALPVLFLPRGNDKFNESLMMNEAAGCADDGGAMDMAAAPDMYCEAADYDEIPQGETAAATQGYDEDTKSGDFDGTTETAAPSVMEDAAQNSSNYDEMNSEEAPDLYQVEVQILDRIQKEEGETFYEAAVLQKGENDSQKGVRIYFRCAGEGEAQRDCADASFRRGEKYILSLYGSGETLESYGIEAGKEELYGEEMYIVYEIILK